MIKALLISLCIVGLAFPQSKKEFADGKVVYDQLRRLAFVTSPETLRIKSYGPINGVYGILMEIGLDNGSASLVSFNTGETSLYFSTGGSVIGASRYDSVRAAAIKFVAMADDFATRAPATLVYPGPKRGEVQFYFLTKQAVLRRIFSEKELQSPVDPFHRLYLAGQSVISQLRLITPRK